MEKLLIQGGRPLHGSVPISGAKNAVLPLMASTILGADSFTIRNVPDLRDVHTMCRLLEELGGAAQFDTGMLEIDTQSIDTFEAPYELVKKMRASVLVLGPLLARFGEAVVSLPGGCAIGNRPIDMHLSGLEKMGAKIELDQGNVHARAGQLTGAQITLDFPSVGATENLMMAAAAAHGKTVIENAAREPEIEDLAGIINGMGGAVQSAGSDRLEIKGTGGVDTFHGSEHRVIPDRIETGTYLTAAAITGGKVTAERTEHRFLNKVLNKMSEAGVTLERHDNGNVTVDATENHLESVDVVTSPYPGFPTDMQAQFMALMCVTKGVSTIKETIFEDRFTHVLELQRLGADIRIDGNTVAVHSTEELQGAPVMATDLRASAALVNAGLAANGTTEIRRLYHLDRGYENLVEKLLELGASVERIPSEGP